MILKLKNTARFCIIASFLLSFGAASARGAFLYSVTDLGTLGGTGASNQSYARAINDTGEIAGYAYNQNNYSRAYLNDTSMYSLGSLGGTTTSSWGYGINSTGEVVGASEIVTEGNNYAFIHDGASMTKIPVLSNGYTNTAYAINDSGLVVGYSYIDNSYYHAFLYNSITGDSPLDLGVFGDGKRSMAYAINNSGQIAGWANYSSTSNNEHAFLRTVSGNMIDLGTLGGSMSVAYGINNNGQIIGEAYRSGSGGDHAFRCTVDDAGIPHMIDLGTLTGGAFSAGYGINDNGLVVGLAYVNGTVSHAFLHDGTSMYDLNSLMDGSGSGWVLQEARDINNLGQIVGYGRHDGSTHAFLLTPVPEPATWILLAVAMSFLVLVCRRKRQ